MQIVINVDNELYEYFSKRRTMHDVGYFSHVGELIKALRDGSLLPKGHGRLIDAKEVYKKFYCRCLAGAATEVLNETLTIIEADKKGDIYAD
jgi:hypothetical protein